MHPVSRRRGDGLTAQTESSNVTGCEHAGTDVCDVPGHEPSRSHIGSRSDLTAEQRVFGSGGP
jgi:hypothetical protein